MATKKQKTLFKRWAEGTDFVRDPEKSLKAEFARLAQVRGWVGGDENWRSHWEKCFGEVYVYLARPPSMTSTSTGRVITRTIPVVTDEEAVYDGLDLMTGDYWNQFAGFVPEQGAEFKTQFDQLAAHQGWNKKHRKERWVEAIEAEFDSLYGRDFSKLDKWQSLCLEVGIDPAPKSIKKCKAALETKVLVNLVNLIDHRRLGVPLIRFDSYAAFRNYTINGYTYPKERAKQEGFIKALLRKIF